MQINIDGAAYFQDEPLPEGAELAGWAALVHALGVKVPVRHPSCVSDSHVRGSRRPEGRCVLFDKRYRPEPAFAAHLTFALRHEDIDLLVLKRVFDAVPEHVVTDLINGAPTGALARRVWFFYETLTGKTLPIEDAPTLTAVPALDPDRYFTGAGTLSARHRVRDNLLGNGDFCPVIRRTPELDALVALQLGQKARDIVGRTGGHVLSRAASFMLLADSKASFEIEGERPPASRIERWGRAVLEAGKRPLNQTEIYRLHRILIGDDRFTPIGYRPDGVFLGERDHNGDPLPEFVGARPQDLPEIMTAWSACNDRMRISGLDPVLQAAALAFGFVYIHPLADGNGRLHRCLIHHVLAERRFSPPGMVFPVSSVMLDRIEAYRDTLRAHSGALMDFIEWRVVPGGNVEVTNDTADLYRFYDCTGEAEFLYRCVQRTVEDDFPREIDYLRRHDQAMAAIMNRVEMPDRLAQQLIVFIRQNGGRLGRRRRERGVEKLRDEEVAAIEAIVRDAFAGFQEKVNT